MLGSLFIPSMGALEMEASVAWFPFLVHPSIQCMEQLCAGGERCLFVRAPLVGAGVKPCATIGFVSVEKQN